MKPLRCMTNISETSPIITTSSLRLFTISSPLILPPQISRSTSFHTVHKESRHNTAAMAKRNLGKEVIVKLIVGAGQASPSPPVGPALGSKGVKSMDFCKVCLASALNHIHFPLPSAAKITPSLLCHTTHPASHAHNPHTLTNTP